ncbi:60 kDa lysophospholipase [Phocoena sinus]|uniref:60 kDa lysophospholipase n=1 Tax=Phocoena sinus TaxID=42100 RepID=UPI0013C43584|nr:60 kDa lysophospholipase [Phocoena sinus]
MAPVPAPGFLDLGKSISIKALCAPRLPSVPPVPGPLAHGHGARGGARAAAPGHLHRIGTHRHAERARRPASPTCPDQRVMYTVLECQPLFDSSDMTITEWVQIAQTIERHYGQYHGFVVIHGTDTMAFAASVLSFMLENLQKTVILTGAQVPIHALWNDGRENLLGALLLAWPVCDPRGLPVLPEPAVSGQPSDQGGHTQVCGLLLPQPAPSGPPWALMSQSTGSWCGRSVGRAGWWCTAAWSATWACCASTPGSPATLVRVFLQPPLKGVVMETFGSGNGPTKPDLLQELRVAAERGLVIVNCTHCLQGAVTSDYGAGTALAGAGTISGSDMTSEAALAKLSYVLGLPGLSLDGRKELLARDLRGEMTLPAVDELRPSLRGSTPGRGVARLLSLSQEAEDVRDALAPSLACAAAHAGDLEALQALAELGSDLSLEDFGGQTPLHSAARGGQAGVVTMLLQRGLDVNARDKDGLSPLLLAVRGRHQAVIGLLRAAGACLSPQELEDSGTELCRLACRADCEGLRAWWQAGADLRQPGYDGRSALHVAEAAGKLEVVALLQSLQGGVGDQALGPRPPVVRKRCLVSNLKLSCCSVSHSFLLRPAGRMRAAPPTPALTVLCALCPCPRPRCWSCFPSCWQNAA